MQAPKTSRTSSRQGAEDNQHIVVPRPLVPVVDGDTVFDLRIVATPGHTPGHIAVLDEALGVLVVGDALTTTDGRPTSYPIGSTEDIEEAQRSVAKLGALDFETLYVGHGGTNPVRSGGAGEGVRRGVLARSRPRAARWLPI